MKINSRQKGAAGEREFAQLLTQYGFPAHRGRQFSGSSDSPDVACASLRHLHFEVKRVQSLNIQDALDQATRDAGEFKIPLVAHRRNGERWKITMYADSFLLNFMRELKILKEIVDEQTRKEKGL